MRPSQTKRIQEKKKRAILKMVVLACLCFALCSLYATAQTASASYDRNKILIGEQVTLTLKAEDINTRTSFLQNWFTLPDSNTHVQVIKTENIDTTDVNGFTIFSQKITITSFDSGIWRMAPMKLVLQDRTTGAQTILKTDSLVLQVLPVDVSDMKDYHPVKDILAVEVNPDYTWYYIIGAALIVVVVTIIILNNYFKKKKTATPTISYKETALENALQQLRELEQQQLPEKGSFKLFFSKITEICRSYFDEQMNVNASHLTTDELMLTLIVYLQDEKKRTAFYQLLRLADAAKFAKYSPSVPQCAEAMQTAITSLKHIDQMIQMAKTT